MDLKNKYLSIQNNAKFDPDIQVRRQSEIIRVQQNKSLALFVTVNISKVSCEFNSNSRVLMDYKQKLNLSILKHAYFYPDVRVHRQSEMIRVHPNRSLSLFLMVNITKLSKEFNSSTRV